MKELLKFLRKHWTEYSVISEGWVILKFEGKEKDMQGLIDKLKSIAK